MDSQPSCVVVTGFGPFRQHLVNSSWEAVKVKTLQLKTQELSAQYVCDYTYYLSLHHGKGCAALIHVPPLSRGLPASLLGRALQVIIQEMLEECGKARVQSPVRRKLNHGATSQRELTGALLL
ncbi:pyroglutamyl-peptidase 1-like protein isoform X3 [Macaca fascicularis]|uniref:pyroglutamyl-peptidase 1-like protein isoform X3 n=1 Tax=Macaca fascicularis TaxID=9541 RepID=UPI003D15D32E